jgi:hypothetical protein
LLLLLLLLPLLLQRFWFADSLWSSFCYPSITFMTL